MFGKSIPVFCYHAVCEEDGHSPATFASHLDMILEMGFKTITADHLFEICMGRKRIDDKYVVLTFDDCHISNWINVVPMLEERGMTGVFFAVSDFIGSGKIRTRADVSEMLPMREAFIKALSEKDTSQFMNEAELKSLVHDKGMEVYAHTCRHQGCFKDFRHFDRYRAGSHWSTWGFTVNLILHCLFLIMAVHLPTMVSGRYSARVKYFSKNAQMKKDVLFAAMILQHVLRKYVKLMEPDGSIFAGPGGTLIQ